MSWHRAPESHFSRRHDHHTAEVMKLHEPSEEARWVLRIGGASAIAGAILGGVGNLAHPVTPENDPVGVAQVIADSDLWAPVHLAIVLGIFLR